MAREISLIRGIADLVIIDDDGIAHIIDFKTADDVGKDPSEFLRRHQRYVAQVQTYAAILKNYGITVGENYLIVYETHYTNETDNEADKYKHLRLDDITFHSDNIIRVPNSGIASDQVTKFF